MTIKLNLKEKELQKLTARMGKKNFVRKDLVPLAERIALLYETEMVKLAPHDKGYLENSSQEDTRLQGGKVVSTIEFKANYAAEVHELAPHRRGTKTRAKPATKFGVAGPKWVERVLRGMDYNYYLTRGLRRLLKEKR